MSAVVTCEGVTDVGYYCSGGSEAPKPTSYYLDAPTDGEPPGVWRGRGAAILGLSGTVDDDDMRKVFEEFINPRDGESIGRAVKRFRSVDERLTEALEREPGALPERVDQIRAQLERSTAKGKLGWDLTFSVPKSVTAAWTASRRAEIAALRDGDLDGVERFHSIRVGIEAAIEAGNLAMLDRVEQVMVTRVGRHGGKGTDGRWVAAPHAVVASFFQHTNRNIDPHLHVHNVILNRVQTGDGRWLAIDAADMMPQQKMFGAIAGRVMEERLADMGFQFARREDGVSRELVVVPPELCDRWSSRDEQITKQQRVLVDALQERLGRDLTDLEVGRLKRLANRMTRQGKDAAAPESVEEMLSRWDAEGRAEGKSLDALAEEMAAHLAAPKAVPETWSPSAVVSEALAELAAGEPTWLRAHLVAAIESRLPTLGLPPVEAVALVDQLADQALVSAGVVQVSGRPDVAPWRPGSLVDDTQRPTAARYATTGTLRAEEHLRLAAITRGRQHVDAAQVDAWLDEHAPSIYADQRAVVRGIASSDAALCMLVGPAGAGKSFAAGALAGAWGAGTGGRVIGLATSQAATKVLQDDGLAWAANIAQWRHTQKQIKRYPGGEQAQWALRSNDLVMVDETSMASTADLDAIRGLVEAAGARLVLAGDPRQLGAVEAGGAMTLLEGHAETYTLADVRRFKDERGRIRTWEVQASLRLRDGDTSVLGDYDRHGRLRGYRTVEQAMESAAAAAVADRVAGRSTVVVTSSSAEAARVANTVRERLVALGRVQADGVLLGRDRCTAGVGDIVSARRNDWRIGVTNRLQYEVAEVHEDGSLTVRALADLGAASGTDAARGGQTYHLPRGYVAEHVQLGYAGTVHAAQGITVHSAHLVTTGGMDLRALYVAMTRGSRSNTAHVATTRSPEQDMVVREVHGGVVCDGDQESPSPRTVLEHSMTRPENGRAATVEAEADAERLASMDHLLSQIEGLTRQACRTRLDEHLDDLQVRGLLSTEDRARLCADQATQPLARLLRAVEQSGRDPRRALERAVTKGGLGAEADSVARVLFTRINPRSTAPLPAMDAPLVPQGIDEETTRTLDWLHGRVADRAAQLGARTAQDRPAWAIEHLGPVPADEGQLAEWERRAGIVAAHREAVGYVDPWRPLGQMPTGVSSTERRALYVSAWEALDRPEDTLDTSTWTEGQIRSWIRAGSDAERWAPAMVDDALRAAEVTRADAATSAQTLDAQATHAQDQGDPEEAARLRALAEQHRSTVDVQGAAVEELTVQAEARDGWYATSLPTLAMRDRAQAEAQERGWAVGAEPDRTTGEEWLAAERRAREADDPHRVITEVDVEDHSRSQDGAHGAVAPADLDQLPEATDRPASPGFARTVLDAAPSAWAVQVNAVAARVALERAADARNQDEQVPASERWQQRWLVQEDTHEQDSGDVDRYVDAAADGA